MTVRNPVPRDQRCHRYLIATGSPSHRCARRLRWLRVPGLALPEPAGGSSGVTVVKVRAPSAARSGRRAGSTSLTYTHHAALWSGHPSTAEAAEHVRRTLCLDDVIGLDGSTHVDLADGRVEVRYRIYVDAAKGAVVALFPVHPDELPVLLAELEAILRMEAAPEQLGTPPAPDPLPASADPYGFLACREDRGASQPPRASHGGGDASGLALAAFALSLCSVLVPVALWFCFPTVSSDAVAGLGMLCLGGCCASVLGFVAGIGAWHHPLAVVAVLVSPVGGLLSLLAAFALGMALALGGLNAGL